MGGLPRLSVAPFTEGGPPPVGPAHVLSRVAPFPKSYLPESPRKALLLVAHPDDETIFAGGLMLARNEWEWHVVCMTGVEERRAQFNRAMEAYRNCGVNIAYTRNHEFIDRAHLADRRLWLAALAKEDCSSWDIVLTHGARGEYGHHHHIWLNHIAHLLYENVWDFFNPGAPVEQLGKTHTVSIPTDERKAGIFFGAYGDIALGLQRYAPYLTDAQMSGKPEYFTQAVLGL
jgi:hypothetical protein